MWKASTRRRGPVSGDAQQAFDRRERFAQHRLRREEHRWMLGIGVPRFGHDGCLPATSACSTSQSASGGGSACDLGGRLMEAQEQERHGSPESFTTTSISALRSWRSSFSESRSTPRPTSTRARGLFNRTVGISGDVRRYRTLYSPKLEFLGSWRRSRGSARNLPSNRRTSRLPSSRPRCRQVAT